METNYMDKIGSYSCSNNIKNVIKSTRAPKNFYLMTLKQLTEYWDDMDKKINKENNNKYNDELEYDLDDLEI